jgi:hypothetical protein
LLTFVSDGERVGGSEIRAKARTSGAERSSGLGVRAFCLDAKTSGKGDANDFAADDVDIAMIKNVAII